MNKEVKILTIEEIGLLNEMKKNCLNGSKYKDEKAKDKFYMLCHLEDFVIKHDDLQQENKQLKDNQVRAMNKIRDFINNANCEIKEGKYSNDNHELYWKLFRKKLTNIQKLIKGINTDEYVNIPKYREEELLNLEDNWDKLKDYIRETKLKEFEKSYGKRFGKTFTQAEVIVCNMILDKMQELEGDNNE